MQPLIVWEKWKDPFGEKDNDIIDYDNYDDNDDEKDSLTAKVLLTPMGIIPYNDNTASCKIFNFWLGHTNFSITHNICDIIENMEGVETLDIFTRYRFRISVGKAFDDSEVMRNINEIIYKYLEEIKNG